MTRTTARAISAITSAPNRRLRPGTTAADRPPMFISALKSPRDTRSAGNMPTRNATRTTHPPANRNTFASIDSEPNRGKSSGPIACRTWIAPKATASPRTPPNAQRTKLSVINWRTMCHLRAPSTSRSANSFDRTTPRASKRFATFMHAIKRRTTVAADTISNVNRKSPTTSLSNGCASNSSSRPSGHRSIRSAKRSSSPRNWGRVTPGFTRT
jgi:hypothetical protein